MLFEFQNILSYILEESTLMLLYVARLGYFLLRVGGRPEARQATGRCLRPIPFPIPTTDINVQFAANGQFFVKGSDCRQAATDVED